MVIQAVPALEMISGIFAWVTTGAIAIADGENTTPAISLTLSQGDQLGRHRLGVGAGGRALVALDDVELVGLEVLGVQLHVEIERLDLRVAEVGVDPGERQHEADLDGLRRRDACAERQRERQRGRCSVS